MNSHKLGFSENTGQQLFVPKVYAFSRHEELLEYIFANPLAQLFSAGDNLLQATSTPLILDPGCTPSQAPDKLVFLGHIAKRNPQCKAIESGCEALAVFTGASAYICPSWFANANTVPTWSFIAVHLRGRLVPIRNAKETREILEKTITHMELNLQLSGDSQPWSLEQAPQQRVDLLFQHILAFRFIATSVEGVKRLNQEKDSMDQESIMRGLQSSPQPGAREIARLMSENSN